ncbi:MmyB family transcriptional regulator [Goodfellowiella coeruleoviolacea]|uniref:MmyB family transcriptional regulator n=1 Tax=Goodfellowiella coeruleoviolacea TaxID=334858 RepID=UPI003898F44A
MWALPRWSWWTSRVSRRTTTCVWNRGAPARLPRPCWTRWRGHCGWTGWSASTSLSEASPEFRRAGAEHGVGDKTHGRYHCRHPVVGEQSRTGAARSR